MNSAPYKYPIYPLKTLIDSKHSSQTLLKNNPKHLSSLKIHVPYPFQYHSATVKKLHHQLKKIARRSKSIRSLDLTHCQIALELFRNRMKGLTKTFRRLQNITISNYNSDKKAALAAYYWLKAAPSLQKFRSFSGFRKSYVSSSEKKRNHAIFLRHLKKAKLLQRLEINFFSDFLVPSVFKKLKHIKQICLRFIPDPDENIKMWLQLQKCFGFAHKLEALEFRGTVIQVNGLCIALVAIPNPKNITSLAINTNPRQYQVCHQLSTVLFSFKSLTKLALKLYQGVMKLGIILEAVQNCPLVDLDLHIHIPKEEMNLLEGLLGSFTQLKTLRLVMETSLIENDEKYLIPLMAAIKGLVLLKSLEISIIPRFVTNWILNGVVLTLGESIAHLGDLQDLKFDFAIGNYGDEVGCLMKSLQNRGKKMKKLSLDLMQQELREDSKEQLMKFLEGAEGLEELELKSLRIENKEFCESFKEGILQMKRLKELRLDRIMILKGKEIYLRMVEKVIAKRGFAVYSGDWSDIQGVLEGEERINMREVMKRNRYLRQVDVPASMRSEFEDFNALYMYECR